MEAKNYCHRNVFCSCNSTIWPIWQHNGISRCLFEIFFSGTMILLTAGLLFMTLKNRRFPATALLSRQRTSEVRFKLKVVILLLLFVEPIARYGIVFTSEKHITGIGFLVCASRILLVFGCVEVLLLKQKHIWNNMRFDTTLLLMWACLLLNEVLAIISWKSKSWWFNNSTYICQIEFAFWIVRLCLSLCLFVLGLNKQKILHKHERLDSSREDTPTKYGHGNLSTWSDFKKKICLLFPFMWPTKSIVLQLKLAGCIGLLISGRVVNPYVPIYYKNIVNSLVNQKSWQPFWKDTALYIVIKCLQGSGISGGLIHGLRLFLSIKVEQYTTRTVQVKLFSHLHSLSLQWHLQRKTGEVMESMQRGTASITKLLYTILFQLLPSICDLIIAVVYFTTVFNAWFGLLITVWIVFYLVATVWIIEWKTKFQRVMNLKDNYAKHIAYDSLLNFETVKCFTTEQQECTKFQDAIVDFQHSEYWTNSTLVLLNMVQMLVVHFGLLAGTLLCGKYVLDGTLQIGDFILFETYITQLYQPLGTLGHYYRLIQNCFIDMENMLDLFNEKRDIVDKPDAITLPSDVDVIEFQDVCSSYSLNQPVLKHVSFSMTAGQTVALVGASGSGKSTIARLLLRFIKPDSGTIKLNEHDIKTVTQKSLRNTVGLVPQDCVLFNDTIRNNLTYGMDAFNDNICEAAEEVDIHDGIVAKPDKYETIVGERGLGVSGGERQRITIARTILKNSNILIFDEPTAAQDNAAAIKIHQIIYGMCKEKTALVVTHRLSMAVDADFILVLRDGEIVERGSHSELMSRDEVYANMWKQQLREAVENVNSMKCYSQSSETADQRLFEVNNMSNTSLR